MRVIRLYPRLAEDEVSTVRHFLRPIGREVGNCVNFGMRPFPSATFLGSVDFSDVHFFCDHIAQHLKLVVFLRMSCEVEPGIAA